MVLQALNRYYDILAADAENGIAPPGYCIANVSFSLNLSSDGKLLDIIPLISQVQQGKKMVGRPRRLLVPEQVKRSSGVSPNFLCDSPVYVLGITEKNPDKPEYALQRFEAFRTFNTTLLAEAGSPSAQAVIAFLKNHDPLTARENPVIQRYITDLLAGGNLVFQVESAAQFVHEDPVVKRFWEEYSSNTAGVYVGQCLVTGENGPIARLHPSVKGVADANPTGATLVGFNAAAYESYNRSKGQGLNSPVGEKAAFAYSTVLNHLLSRDNPNRKFMVGDTTVVYWADSPNNQYGRIFSGLFQVDWDDTPQDLEKKEVDGQNPAAGQRLGEIGRRVRGGELVKMDGLMEDLDPQTRFYVLGLAPNAGRVAVRFFHQDAFESTVRKIVSHYQDMAISKEFPDQPTWIPLYQLLGETISKKSSDKKGSPLLAGAVLRAILDNTPYPAALFYALINRIRVDADDKDRRIQKINYTRAAALKAILTRKYRHQPNHLIQEVLCMSLNDQATQPAYVLGRLFAVLEKAQQDAIGDVNASIKDRYFTSACANPASVFPVLLRLSQHHISRGEHGKFLDRKIEETLNLLDVEKNPIPSHLSLDEQGVFVLGYYHQRADFFVKRSGTSQAKPEPAAEQEPEQMSLINNQ